MLVPRSTGSSFILSSVFQTSASRGLGSGMDSRPSSDHGDEALTLGDLANNLPPDGHTGDGNNSLSRRPGLEGANSDTEDAGGQSFPLPPLPSDDQRQTVAGAIGRDGMNTRESQHTHWYTTYCNVIIAQLYSTVGSVASAYGLTQICSVV